jgi:hypothetical protein
MTVNFQFIFQINSSPKFFNNFFFYLEYKWSAIILKQEHRDRDRMVDLKLPEQSTPITTEAVSSNLVHGDVYSIQHYAIKFVSDLRQVDDVLRVLRFPPTKQWRSFHWSNEAFASVKK